MSLRLNGIYQLKTWASEQIEQGRDAAVVHRELIASLDAIEQDFRIDYDVPGTQYAEVFERETNKRIGWRSIRPGEILFSQNVDMIERLTRNEFLSRQGIEPGKERL